MQTRGKKRHTETLTSWHFLSSIAWDMVTSTYLSSNLAVLQPKYYHLFLKQKKKIIWLSASETALFLNRPSWAPYVCIILIKWETGIFLWCLYVFLFPREEQFTLSWYIFFVYKIFYLKKHMVSSLFALCYILNKYVLKKYGSGKTINKYKLSMWQNIKLTKPHTYTII